MIVVDARVVVTALADDDRARERLGGKRLVAPHLIDPEVASAGGALGDLRVALALDDLRALRLERVAHVPLLRRSWQLRTNLTIYDAAYVALAELLDTTLVTADRRLARTPGIGCAVDVPS